jgi:ribosomal protein S18 acetylase RimI-like enzyme
VPDRDGRACPCGQSVGVEVARGGAGAGDDLPDCKSPDEAQRFGLEVLPGDLTALPDALADYMIDRGFDYAAAVAEAARWDERQGIASRLLNEAVRRGGSGGEGGGTIT